MYQRHIFYKSGSYTEISKWKSRIIVATFVAFKKDTALVPFHECFNMQNYYKQRKHFLSIKYKHNVTRKTVL